MNGTPRILNSWKEIASYLGRGVRTVQRWESKLGLPVRRPNGHMRSAVIALSNEVDQWLLNTPRLNENGNHNHPHGATELNGTTPIPGDGTAAHAVDEPTKDAPQTAHRTEPLRTESGSLLKELVGKIEEMENRSRKSKTARIQAQLRAS